MASLPSQSGSGSVEPAAAQVDGGVSSGASNTAAGAASGTASGAASGTASGSGSGAPGNTTAGIDSETAEVRAGRAAIDALDAEILRMIRARVDASAQVQQARVASGGRRLSLSREAEILARYREALGRPGITIAMAVLDVCRGPLVGKRPGSGA